MLHLNQHNIPLRHLSSLLAIYDLSIVLFASLSPRFQQCVIYHSLSSPHLSLSCSLSLALSLSLSLSSQLILSFSSRLHFKCFSTFNDTTLQRLRLFTSYLTNLILVSLSMLLYCKHFLRANASWKMQFCFLLHFRSVRLQVSRIPELAQLWKWFNLLSMFTREPVFLDTCITLAFLTILFMSCSSATMPTVNQLSTHNRTMQ